MDSILSGKRILVVLGFMAAGICALTAARLYITVLHGFNVDFISGAWLSLARDLQDGVFYRPLYSPDMGFGGTRYFPLYFTLLALFLYVIPDIMSAFAILTVLSTILLVTGIFKFLREMGIDRVLAFLLSFLLLATLATQSGIDTMRCDILCAALNAWGLRFFVRWETRKSPLLPCVVFFVLAFATKMTGIFGAMGVLIYLFLNSPKRALVLGFAVGVGVFVCLGAMYFGSAGRIFDILATCSSGGVIWSSLLKGPWTMFFTMTQYDLPCFMFVFLAAIYAASKPVHDLRSIVSICFLVALLIVAVVFSSPGVWVNHFVDIAAASLLLLGYGLSQDDNAAANSYVIGLAFAFFVGIVVLTRMVLVYDVHRQTLDEARAVLSYVGTGDRPMIAEDPMIPILGNEQVYVPEPYMLRVVTAKLPAIKERLLSDLEKRKYRAIVFIKNPELEREWYTGTHFGREFVDCVMKDYMLGKRIGSYFVYLPRPLP